MINRTHVSGSVETMAADSAQVPGGRAWPAEPRRRKVSERLARQIAADILARDMAAGETLPAESRMLATYGVARATLREALRLLETQGLIRLKAGLGGGPVVAGLAELPAHFADMTKLHFQRLGVRNRDVLQARTAIEPAAARFAAENANPRVHERLEAIMSAARQLDVDDDESFIRHSIEFHDAITESSGNPVLDLLALSLRELSAPIEFRARHLPDRDRRAVLAAHAAIAEAIIDGRGDVAERLVRDHMAETAQVADTQQPAALDAPVTWD